MVVQLSLVLGRKTVRSVHLGHLLKRVEDGGCDALVRAVDDRPYLESVRPNQLALKAVDEDLQGVCRTSVVMWVRSQKVEETYGEVLDERRYTLALFDCEFCALNRSNDGALREIDASAKANIMSQIGERTMNCSSWVFSRCSCFWKRLTTKAMLRCSASTRKRSLAAMTPTMPLEVEGRLCQRKREPWQKKDCQAYMMSRCRAPSTQALSSMARNPKMRSIDDRMSCWTA